ncbi:hypothetical protein AX774_g4232 [Zancudomyces culisetae]|uniref:Uncharacterized protein n=1 Tax=Zancudomyces culisetae TaxID=1213189 RepID=A0A1R1PMV4_ZANCU|nr:hypothetical protein AX774_g4232 [Zancudomyces culisetae]|eukprot:OMH82284.1 hypothetical protein AX774_g4232 [Zancudomyces culisetae]
MADNLDDDFYLEDSYKALDAKSIQNVVQKGRDDNKNKRKQQTQQINVNSNKKSKVGGKKNRDEPLKLHTVELQTQLWNEMLKRVYRGISDLEMEEIKIDKTSIFSEGMSIIGEKGECGDNNNLSLITSKGLEIYGDKEPENPGMPKIMLISNSAIRAIAVEK